MLVGQGAMPHTPQANREEGHSGLRAAGRTEEDVRELFQHAGTLGRCASSDDFTGRSRGFGLRGDGHAGSRRGCLFLNRHLVVDEARPQPQRGRGGLGPRTSGAGGGGGWRGSSREHRPGPRKETNQGVADAPSRAVSRMRRGHEGPRLVPSGNAMSDTDFVQITATTDHVTGQAPHD